MKRIHSPKVCVFSGKLVFLCYNCGRIITPSTVTVAPKVVTLQFECICGYYNWDDSGSVQTFFSQKVSKNILRMNTP